eukprot:scaffold3405_cov127-Cylindrotheca_fusiformis.AAC.2
MVSGSFTLAKRANGVCQGSLHRTLEERPGVSSSSSKNTMVYCIFFGVQLVCYESIAALDEGEFPIAAYKIVAMSSSGTDAFRLVTSQGTHLLCRAPTTLCREIWLSAITAGLERTLAGTATNTATFEKVKPRLQNRRHMTAKAYCHSCGKLERYEFPLIKDCSPLLQYCEEERVDLCEKCCMAQGVVDHVLLLQEMHKAQELDYSAIRKARAMVLKQLQPDLEFDDVPVTTRLRLTPNAYHMVSQVMIRPEFKALQRGSTTLDDLVQEFDQGIIGVLEFLELMEQSVGIRDKEMAALKKQAFRMAGDMGTSLKLLAEQALPDKQYTSTELLQCILDFLLDLCKEGEIQTIAFYWPQLCNIHLQMLPPTDAASMKRIELVEDFLLTIATNHSIHLAIELIWNHTADLEDAKTLKYCCKRKFAVIRFLCELESVIFDFDSGWGGGSVAVGNLLAPSNHQIQLLRDGMAEIQKYRMQQTEHLTQSCRLDKLRRGDDEEEKEDANPETMAKEALRIARNADYLSTHLAFTKRLCDIAEKLRFAPVPNRASMLQSELIKLNTSGAMGGDPLNVVKDSHSRVVRIPSKEGHVFRSKERTPVLLLIELNDEGVTHEESNGSGLNQKFKSEKLKEEQRNIQAAEEDAKEAARVEEELRIADANLNAEEKDDNPAAETASEGQKTEIDSDAQSTSIELSESANSSQDPEPDSGMDAAPAPPTSPTRNSSLLTTPTPKVCTPGGSNLEDPGSREGRNGGSEQRRKK